MSETLWNWARSHAYAAARLHEVRSVDELRDVVARATRVKALGTRHSFNDVADTVGELVSLRGFTDITLDTTGPHPRVTVGAGVTYGDLCRRLDGTGYALHNLASLPHISVAGAVATATHGSGDANGNLATAVHAIELMTADGAVRCFTRDADPDVFPGAVVALGALGIAIRVTLNLVPAFDIAQTVYEALPFTALTEQFDAITCGAYSVSLFTDWRGETINQLWVKRRGTATVGDALDPRALGAAPAPRDVHPLPGMPAENCTAQLGIPGPWHARLPHFRMEFTPSSGEELQSEYFVPRHHAVAALRAVRGLSDRVAPLLQVSEIRTIAADDLWLSPCYRQACVGIHFTWKKDWTGVRAVLQVIESALEPFAPRPHWGKLFTMSAGHLRSRYERFDDFRGLARQFDPRGKFQNPYLDRLFAAP